MSASSVTADSAGATGTDRGGKHKGPKSSIWARFDHVVVPYILVSPFFILFIAFGIFPIVYSALVSFQTYRAEQPVYPSGNSVNLYTERWVGLENYQRVLTNWDFTQALLNTLGLFIVSAIPQLFFALVLASLLNRRLRAQSLFRIGILIPYITPIVASTLVFTTFFSEQYGQANWVLGLFGVEHTSGVGAAAQEYPGIDWRAERWSAWLALVIMINWKWTGYNALLYLAAMQSIPKDVYEAAALDGAGAWRQLWSITVPMIRPMVIFTVVLSTIGSLQLFAEPVLFDEDPSSGEGGGLRHLWRTVAQLIWYTGWGDPNDFGLAGAMSWLLFVVVVALAAFNAFISNKIGGRK
ncbi:carbohydrate ABC transporter permease [Demequina activiva]|uniref:ABC transporter permease n=1 Tax=Demequina activiva TaxID=1582364 RepID=A0A919PZE2_9MICO|nr:sugar ABC transporter permease [Demequina activiva]GIG53505.1 ABC transporter permease [Demequina activiva]